MPNGDIFITDRLKECSWGLIPRQSAPFARGGGSQVIVYGYPYWSASFRYENLDDAGMREMSAWLAGRQGSRYSFLAYRPRTRLPAGGATSNSGVTLAAVDTANSELDFTGLPHALEPGDMVSYYTAASGYYCGEVVSAGAYSAGAQTVGVQPPPVAEHASTPNPRIVEALCEFQIEGQPQIVETHDKRYTVSFGARQVERA